MGQKIRCTVLLCLLSVPSSAGEADIFFNRGRQAAQRGDAVTAFSYFLRARALDPSNINIQKAVREASLSASQTLAALGDYRVANEISNLTSVVTNKQYPVQSDVNFNRHSASQGRGKKKALLPPVRLNPWTGKYSFEIDGSVAEIYKTIARKFGLKVAFDSDFKATQKVYFKLDQVDFETAIRSLNNVVNAIVIPVSEVFFLVADNSTNKRSSLEPVSMAFIPFPEAMNDEQLSQLGKAVQQVLDIKRLQIDRAGRQIVLRDTIHRVQIAHEIYRRLSHSRAEVVFEVDLIALNESNKVDFGLKIPTAFPVTNFSNIWRNKAQGIDVASFPLLGIGAGKMLFGIGVADTFLTAKQFRSTGRRLQTFRLRSSEGQPAILNIGERFPIINTQFSAVVNNQQIRDQERAGTLRQAFPSFTFEDLGLSFSATPRVHSANEISAAIEIEIQLLSGRTVNDIPILLNRSFSSMVRLRANQTALISGMKIFERRKGRSGIWPLSRLPILGHFFRAHANQFNMRELVILLRPHVITLPAAEIELSPPLYYGSEVSPLSAL